MKRIALMSTAACLVMTWACSRTNPTSVEEAGSMTQPAGTVVESASPDRIDGQATRDTAADILLVLLTANDKEGVRASFALQDDMASCQKKLPVMRGVFAKGGIEVLEIGCMTSRQTFSKFSHQVPAGSPSHHFLLVYAENGAPLEVKAVADAAACQAARANHLKQKTEKHEAYCATAPQSLLAE